METISDSFGIRGSVESLIGGRNENQDSYGMAETRLGMLVVVCDGMGGGPAGKTASSIATQSIIDYVSGADANQSPLSVLTDAVVSANEAILAAVTQNPTLRGMGTTCVGVLVGKDNAYIVHVGDSRCYQIRSGKVVFRTADHSYVGELVRRGTLSEEEARNSKYSNVITRAIGAAPTIDPELDTVSYHAGDRFALMSDGIWGTMPEQQLVRFLSEPTDPATLVPNLARNVDTLGFDNGGGHDNLTLAVIDIPGKKSIPANPIVVPAAGPDTPTKIAPPTTPKATPAPAPKQTKPAQKPKADSDTDAHSPKKSHAVSITLIIATAVVICFIFFLFFYFQNPKEGKEIDTPKTEQSQDEKKLAEADQSGNNASQPGTDHPRKSAVDEVNRAAEAVSKKSQRSAETPKPQAEQTQAQPKTTLDKPENAYFQAAIDGLIEIRDYKPKDVEMKSTDAYAKIRKIRTDMIGPVLKNIREGINLTQNSAKKELAEKIYQTISNTKNKITIVDNSGNYVSTHEAVSFTNDIIGRLKHLLVM